MSLVKVKFLIVIVIFIFLLITADYHMPPTTFSLRVATGDFAEERGEDLVDDLLTVRVRVLVRVGDVAALFGFRIDA
jgi:hypothetical protein